RPRTWHTGQRPPMSSPPEPLPRQRRYSVRHQVRLDEETAAKLETLEKSIQRKRGPSLRYVMQWAISHSCGWTIDQSLPTSLHLVPVLVEPRLYQQVQEVAALHGASIAAWVRQAMRQVTINDFPETWRAGESAIRSNDSRYFGQRFMLRLNETTTQQLQRLVERFAKS